MDRKVLWGVTLGTVILAAYVFLSDTSEPKILTTNIDVVNKIIRGEEETLPEETDATFYSLFRTVAENFRDAVRDDATMLAAATKPGVKFIKINPGMRKEEIAEVLGQKLSWNDSQKSQFMNVGMSVGATNAEGYYYPDVYVLPKNASGYEMGKIMINRFNEKIMPKYASSTQKIVNVDTAIKIASIIEREAAGKNDMRLISGIIWNRTFKNMSLDMDATLQYVKGSEEDGWWPKVESKDKFIESPYNTYQNKGLTPTPISNPHLSAINAALNPKRTSCLFYLHDKYRRIHCSVTYKEHVNNIERYYGK